MNNSAESAAHDFAQAINLYDVDRLTTLMTEKHRACRSEGHAQIPAARIFRRYRMGFASRVFGPNHFSVERRGAEKVFLLNRPDVAPRVFGLNRNDLVQVHVAKVFHGDRHYFALGIFHLNHHFLGPAMAPDQSFMRTPHKLMPNARRCLAKIAHRVLARREI